MALFQIKKIKSFIVFIIVLVTILWVFQDKFLNLLVLQKVTKELISTSEDVKETPYFEKIDNFLIKEYSREHVLLHVLEAETYYSFKDSPVQLFEVKVRTFNDGNKEGLVLNSNRAEINKLGEIFLNGEINIQTKTGISHELVTESLVVLSDVSKIKSNKKVTYLGETAKIISEGMEMSINSDTMHLSGVVNIFEESGVIIDTSNLYVSHNAGEKKYKSKEPTAYHSQNNVVNSTNGVDIDMNLKLVNLLGDVEVLSISGGILKSSNIVIDQSNDGEVFKSNYPSHFYSDAVNIKANNMHYDAVTKKLKLMNRVVAVYE